MHAPPPPDITALEVPIASLASTARSLALAAQRAGYTIRATRSLGPRLPRQAGQQLARTSSLALTGVMTGWRFTATKPERDAWDVLLWRPGWPGPAMLNVSLLQALLRHQTPADLGKVPR